MISYGYINHFWSKWYWYKINQLNCTFKSSEHEMEELNFPKLIKLLFNHINFGNCFHSDDYITNYKKWIWLKIVEVSFYHSVFSNLLNVQKLNFVKFSQYLNNRFICIIHTSPVWSRSSYLGDSTNWTSASFSRWLDLFLKWYIKKLLFYWLPKIT